MAMAHWLAATAWTSVLSPLPQMLQPVQVTAAMTGFNEITISQSATSRQQNSTPVSSTAAMERSILQQINQYRQQKGLALLNTNSTITRQARLHSRNMASSRAMTHDGFEARVANIGKVINYRGAAENVAYNMGFSTPDRQAVEGWIKSTGHRQNIEGNYNLTGIGVAKNRQGEYYFTQIFIKQ